MLTLVLGGARSGKSRLAQRLAEPAACVIYIATAQILDDAEMASRVARHRASRPPSWQTVEEPIALAEAVERAALEAGAVLVDCLTLWLSNLFRQHLEDTARAQLVRIAAASHRCRVILVSNELGSGTVPESALTRAFRDAHGVLNQSAAEAADEVILTVAGLPLYLKTASQPKDLP